MNSNPVEQLRQITGVRLGPSEAITIDQRRINTFTEATDDHQWIHIDPQLAAAGPFGTTIAQGYLTMSLIVPLIATIDLSLDPRPAMTINYGLNRLRFVSPVPVDSSVLAWMTVLEVEEIPSGAQVVREVSIEIPGGERPALVAETVTRMLWH